MPTIISGKNFKLTQTLKDYVSDKLHKVEKYSSEIIETKVELDHDHNQRTGLVNRVELSVTVPGKVIKAGQKAEHMKEAFDLCLSKLTRQLSKYKDKTITAKRRIKKA